MKPQILGRHTSYNVQKVLWLADELAVDYQHIEIGGRFAGNDTSEFLSLNALGKVPVLVMDQHSITESNTILRFLADKYVPGQWIATEPYEKSRVDRWLDWSLCQMEPAFTGVFWGHYRTPAEDRNWSLIEQGIDNTKHCLTTLSNQLGNADYLLGNIITLADVATGVFLHRLKHIDLEIVFPENIEQWYERLSKRPAYHKWVMSDFSELQGRSQY